MQRMLHLLFVHDQTLPVAAFGQLVRQLGLQISHAQAHNVQTMEEALGQRQWDAVIHDSSLRPFDWTQGLHLLREKASPLPPFLISAEKFTFESARAMIEAGVTDVVPREELELLLFAIRRELRSLHEEEREKGVREAMEARMQRLQLSQRIGEGLHGILDMPTVFEHVEDTFPKLLNVNRALIFL